MKIDSLEREKRAMRIEVANEKAITADLNAKMEELKIKNDELLAEIKSLETYKIQFLESMNALKKTESQNEYLKQLESELSSKSTQIENLK